MTTTLELPPLAEAMTARDVNAYASALQKQIGPDGKVAFHLRHWSVEKSPIFVVLNDQPYSSRAHQEDTMIDAASWPAAVQAARAWIEARPRITRESRIRKLALTIINIKDEAGRVTAADLTRRDFTAAEVREMHAAACVRAGELCLGSPFVVEGVS